MSKFCIETMSSNGIQYINTKKSYEQEESFYNKSWNITNQNPETEELYKQACKISQLRQNKIDYNCTYSSEIEEKIK